MTMLLGGHPILGRAPAEFMLKTLPQARFDLQDKVVCMGLELLRET